MFGRVETQVLVVGAGPVGLLTALRLVEQGLSVEVIDEQWRPAGHSYALGLHPASLEILDDLGVAKEVVAAGRRITSMSILERRERRASFPLGDGGRFSFVLSLPQSTLESLLTAKLEAQGVRVRWNHRLAGLDVEPHSVRARVERLAKESSGYAVAHTTWVVDRTLDVRASFVVGADGHRSLVRRALEIPFDEIAASQVFAIFECDIGRSVDDELKLVLDGDSVSALWPLPDGRARWSLELDDPTVRAMDRYKSRLTAQFGEHHFPHLDEAQLRALLAERAAWFEPNFFGVGWSIEVRFERRLAATLGRGAAWLAGDAVHLTGPIGMQSMNAGLREADELARAIARIVRQGEPPSILSDLERAIFDEWRFLHGTVGRLAPRPDASPFVASHAGRLLPCLPGTRSGLDTLAERLHLTAVRN